MIPLEREYEAWVVNQLEHALHHIGIRYAIAAVSPKEERDWPSDEALAFEGKVVGLQFKRPHEVKENGHPTAAWNLNSKHDQLGKIKRIQEIYYALPSFLSRQLKAAALHSCLFWRPGPRHVKLTIRHSYARSRSLSSGEFIQGLVECRLGHRPPGRLPVSWYARLLADAMAGRLPPPDRDGKWSRATVLRELDFDSSFEPTDEVTPQDFEETEWVEDQDQFGTLYLIAIATEGGEDIRLA